MESIEYSLNQQIQSMNDDVAKFVVVVMLGLCAILFVKLLKAYLFNSEGNKTFFDVVIIIFFVLIGLLIVWCVFNVDFLITYTLQNWNK